MTSGPDEDDLPPPSKEGAIEPATNAAGRPTSATGVLPEQERWARDRVGWEPRFGTGETAADKADDRTLLDHQTFLESKLDEKFFGGTSQSDCSR